MKCYLVIGEKAYGISPAGAVRALAFLKARTLEDAERVMIESTVTRYHSMEDAARVLGISTKTLWHKRKKFDMPVGMCTRPS